MVTQWQDSVNNSAGLQAHVQRDPSHPTITPLQISSLLFNPAHAHPSNIIILLLVLQLLWVWICHTHIHIWYVFTALVLNYCTKYHHKSVCMCVWETDIRSLSSRFYWCLFFQLKHTHTGRWASFWNTHHLSQTGVLYEMLMIFKCIQCNASVQAALKGSRAHIWPRGSNTSCHARNATEMNRFHTAKRESGCRCD